jgi:hypothetical protein
MNGSLAWTIVPESSAFAEGRVAAVHESVHWHIPAVYPCSAQCSAVPTTFNRGSASVALLNVESPLTLNPGGAAIMLHHAIDWADQVYPETTARWQKQLRPQHTTYPVFEA